MLVRVFFSVSLVAVHLACFCLLLARVLFTSGLAGLHLARVMFSVCLVALHLAWVLFTFG